MNAQAQWVETPLTKVSTRPTREPLALRALKKAIQVYSYISNERAGKWVNSLWFTPRRTGAGSRYEHLLEHADTHTQLRFGVNEIPVYSWGDGPVILFVHGWSGSGLQFGAMVEPLIRQGYRVVTFDMPGHGRAQGDRTNVFEMSEVVQQVAHMFGNVHGIIAHSLGSVASVLAVSQGLSVNKLTLIAPPADLNFVVKMFGQQLDIPEQTLAVHRRLLEEEFGKEVWNKLDLTLHSPSLELDGLVISDLNDDEIPFDHGELIARHWHNARFLKTHSLGHYRILKDADVLKEVSGFLAE
ncbi:alpha/beta hydrolase [Hahella sp. CCB-MM4]|uniref:alpha/beta fold hydrolase n=1 Tax=Hahella sp. (strain CCB-MM4) TaxID=1926491 RepID=UPI000B9B0A24|nr:alpha/beta fold hydrolase [Hahella sp. CCB-MM4]OZG72262.1 alpha/beta hydrolase [Hahella sp. CCB-MM4]